MRYLSLSRLLTVLLAIAIFPAIAWAQDTDAAPADDAATADAAVPATAPEDADDVDEAPTAEDLFSAGRDALFRSRFDEAIKLLSQAVAADETKTSYRLHLARAYRYADRSDEAAEQLEEIIKAAPDHVEAGQMLGDIYCRAEKWSDVVRVLEPLLKYRHDYPTYHMLATAQYNLDKHEDARENFEQAVKLNPKSATDHYSLGNIYLAGKFFALAAESYESAIALGLDSPILRYKLGSAYFNLRNYFGQITVRTVGSGKEGEINDRWYLIEKVPGSKETFRCAPERSAVYQIARAMADGIEDRPDIHILLATIYLNGRRYEKAYEMCIEIEPTVPDDDKALFHYYHAQAALGTGRYDRYIELLGEAIELDRESYQSTLVDAYLGVADRENQAGRLDKYIEYLELAVAQSPQTASLHLKLGRAYQEMREYDKAVAQWRMVLDLEPDHAQRMQLLNLIENPSLGGPPATPSVPAPSLPVASESQPTANDDPQMRQ